MSPLVSFEGVDLEVIADTAHEWLIPTAKVAAGFGVSVETVRSVKSRHPTELVIGKHWVVADCNTLGGPQSFTMWTKRGVVRLGFLLTGDRARRFRDFAEDLVVGISAPPQFEIPTTLAGALRLAADESERADRAEVLVAEMTPKAEIHDALMSADGDMSVREAAQALVRAGVDTGQGRLFASLVAINWLDKSRQPLQRHVDRAVLVRKVTTYVDSLGDMHASTQVRVTPKGLAELVRRLGPASMGLVTG